MKCYSTIIKHKPVHIALLLLSIVLLISCSKKGTSGEEVLSTYPDGSKKVAALFETSGEGKKKFKSFEYYQSGEKKKEYSHKDNLYFGPWTFWYKNGSKLADGQFIEKSLDPSTGTGNGQYYWPDGSVMLKIEYKPSQGEAVVVAIFDQKGQKFTSEDQPGELKEKIRSLLEKWHNGGI